MTEVKVRVVPPLRADGGDYMEFSSEKLLPRFADRVDDLGAAIRQVISSLRAQLDALLDSNEENNDNDRSEDKSQWQLKEMSVSFSLDLEAEGGVILAKGRTAAGFELVVVWSRESNTGFAG